MGVWVSKMTRSGLLMACLAVATTSCGSDANRTCGAGTVEVDGVCVVATADGGTTISDGGLNIDTLVQQDQRAPAELPPRRPEPSNTFAKYHNGAFRFSFTDASGAVACSLVDDPSTPMPYKGIQIYAAFTYLLGGTCPEGTFSLSPANECDPSFPPMKSCARSRWWDEAGSLKEEKMATTGAVVVEGVWVDSLWRRCNFDLELVFPDGEIFTRQFSVLYSDSDSSLPDLC